MNDRLRSAASAGDSKKVRYAVAGVGWIAQEAVLPAFGNVPNSKLVALVTHNPRKAGEIGRRHHVKAIGYEQYDELLASGEIDAVYIALPNRQHREYAVRAARAGVHVLCEKPMAETELDCMEMIEAAQQGGVKLMIAYRLHFEPANLHAIETIRSGRIGEPRFFSSVFSQNVAEGNIRLSRELGGGPLMDMGVYCVNAARYLFRSEPVEVSAFKAQGKDKRFEQVPEMVSAMLRFPGDRLASFTCSFGTADTDVYRVVGTRGDLRLEPGYDYHQQLDCYLTVDGKTEKKSFEKHDQFGAELLYFSNCILNNEEPQPSGEEGLADVRVIRALTSSMDSRIPIEVVPGAPPERPSLDREIALPPIKPDHAVDAVSPTGKH